MNKTTPPNSGLETQKNQEHSRELIRGSITGLTVKLLAAFSAFAMNLAIARTLGASESGLFFLSLTLITIFSVISRIGLDNSLVRYISAEQSQGNSSAVHGVFRNGVLWTIVLSICLATAIAALSEKIASSALKQPGLQAVLVIMIFALPLISLYTIHAQALQGLKKIAKAMCTLNVLVPSFVLTGIFIFPPSNAIDIAKIFTAACAISLVISHIWWRSSAPALLSEPAFDRRLLLASCIPLWGVMILNQTIQWSSQLLLGVWGSPADVALFASAQRTAMLTSFILVAINSIAAPKFSVMHRQGDTDGLRRIAIFSARIMLATAIPALLFMLIFPEWLMGLFGDEFREAALGLQILAIGQFVNILTGSVGFLLIMTGNEKRLSINVLIGALLGVILGILLIPLYGLTGAAIATAVAVASQNLLGVYQVKRALGFNTLAFWQKL